MISMKSAKVQFVFLAWCSYFCSSHGFTSAIPAIVDPTGQRQPIDRIVDTTPATQNTQLQARRLWVNQDDPVHIYITNVVSPQVNSNSNAISNSGVGNGGNQLIPGQVDPRNPQCAKVIYVPVCAPVDSSHRTEGGAATTSASTGDNANSGAYYTTDDPMKTFNRDAINDKPPSKKWTFPQNQPQY